MNEESNKTNKDIVSVYTDGSCVKENPNNSTGYGGWGYCVLGDVIFYDCGGEYNTTNNRMEILAVLKAMEFCKDLYKDIKIHTDSSYVLNCATGKYNRHTNIDLWNTYDKLRLSFEYIEWVKVKGHSGNKWNEYVDKIARLETEKIKKYCKTIK